MAPRAQRSLEAAKKAVPEGTFAVGIGLAVAGITTYGFFIACARGLSEKDYAAVIGGLWPLVFVVAPGCFLPLEQEVGRALAHRRALHIGGGPVVRRAAIAALWGTAGLLLLTLLFSGVLRENLFKGVSGLVICFAIALITYAAQHLTRGTLSGNGRFGPYGVILGAEGCVRLLPAAILWFAGVTNPVAYGLCLQGASLCARATDRDANAIEVEHDRVARACDTVGWCRSTALYSPRPRAHSARFSMWGLR